MKPKINGKKCRECEELSIITGKPVKCNYHQGFSDGFEEFLEDNYGEFFRLQNQRLQRKENPICPNCGRIMEKIEGKTHTYRCACTPNIWVSIG